MAQKTNGSAVPTKTQADGITKIESVRRALAELGREAKPMQIQRFVKERFGIEMNTDHISTSKADILRKMASKGKPAAKPAEARKAAVTPQAKPARQGNGQASKIRLQDLQAVKELVGRVGADQLRALIDVLSA
jgi:hypothetical protein